MKDEAPSTGNADGVPPAMGEVPRVGKGPAGPSSGSNPEPSPKAGGAKPKIRVSLSRKRPKGRDGMLLQCVAIPEEVHREAAIYVVAKGQHGEEPSEFSGLVEKGLRTEMELRPVSEEWKKEALTAIQEADSARAERRKAKEGA